jgi:hypothetical protein
MKHGGGASQEKTGIAEPVITIKAFKGGEFAPALFHSVVSSREMF